MNIKVSTANVDGARVILNKVARQHILSDEEWAFVCDAIKNKTVLPLRSIDGIECTDTNSLFMTISTGVEYFERPISDNRLTPIIVLFCGSTSNNVDADILLPTQFTE